jgi:Cu(I)/Ag(I) efflux system membrane fusion protein
MGGSWQVELRAQQPSGALALADGSLTVGTPGLRLAGRGAAAQAPPAEHVHHAATEAGAPEVAIEPGRLQAIGVRTVTVEELPFESVLRVVGRVTWDESALRDVAPRAGGFVRELHVPATGARVERGAVLLTVYGPELYAAQLEYLQALAGRDDTRATSADPLVRALRTRLRLLELADADVRALERRGEPFEELPLRAPISGVVVERAIVAGASFAAGERLLRIAPDDRVWLEALVYASELAQVAVGQAARVSIPALGGRVVEGRVSWISPDVSPDTRTARARIELDNRELGLPAGAWAHVDLVRSLGPRLSVPESAVLYAGRRRFAFVEIEPGRFRPREVQIGERSGERVEVRSGLVAGERVVASGTFLVAAESRLRTALESW